MRTQTYVSSNAEASGAPALRLCITSIALQLPLPPPRPFHVQVGCAARRRAREDPSTGAPNAGGSCEVRRGLCRKPRPPSSCCCCGRSAGGASSCLENGGSSWRGSRSGSGARTGGGWAAAVLRGACRGAPFPPRAREAGQDQEPVLQARGRDGAPGGRPPLPLPLAAHRTPNSWPR